MSEKEANATQAEKITVSKMSVKTIGCKPKAAAILDDGDTTPIKLCYVYGIATGIKYGEHPTAGPWEALQGTFEAVNLQNGKVFTSGLLFLPSGIHDAAAAAVKTGGENPQIQFGMELRAVKDTNPQGYSYQAVNRLKPTHADILEPIREQLGQWIGKQLAAPAPAAELPAPVEMPAPESPKTQAAGSGKGRK